MKPPGAKSRVIWSTFHNIDISPLHMFSSSSFLCHHHNQSFISFLLLFNTLSSTSAGLISSIHIRKHRLHFIFIDIPSAAGLVPNPYIHYSKPQPTSNITMRLHLVLLALSTIAAAGPLPPFSKTALEARAPPSVSPLSTVKDWG